MEKEMLVHLKFKEGKLETFMGWMQSDEGMGVRKSVAYPEKTIGAVSYTHLTLPTSNSV